MRATHEIIYNKIKNGCMFSIEDTISRRMSGSYYTYWTYIGSRGRTYIQHVREGEDNMRLGFIFPSLTLHKKYSHSTHPKIRMLKTVYDCLMSGIQIPSHIELVIIETEEEVRQQTISDDFDDGFCGTGELNSYLGRIGVI